MATRPLIESHVIPRWLMKTVKTNGQYRMIDPGAGTSVKKQMDYTERSTVRLSNGASSVTESGF